MSPRRVANWLLVVLGVAVAVFGVVRTSHPSVTCRGVEMHPGDVCHKNDFGTMGTEKVQTYEQRVHAAHLSQPVIALTGLGMSAFGLALLRQDRRRGTGTPQGAPGGASAA